MAKKRIRFACPKCDFQVSISDILVDNLDASATLFGECPNPDCGMTCTYDLYEAVRWVSRLEPTSSADVH